MVATEGSGPLAVDRILPLFIGKRVKMARLAYPNSTIEFKNGLNLELGPDTKLYGNWRLCNWCLFRGDEVAFEFEYRSHRLSEPPKSAPL